MKIPTLADILKDPKAKEGLSNLQLKAIIDQLKTLVPHEGDTIQADPASFAFVNSRGSWAPAKHLSYLSSWLADVEAGKRRRILVSMPPRHGKSELISYWFPIWLLARNPARRIILTAYEDDFAMEWGRRVRNAIMDFGDRFGLALDDTSSAAKRWNLTSGGGMRTAGAGGPITGRGADFLIIDDPIKNSEEAMSEVLREKLWNWFQTTAYTRLEPGGSVIIIATRWHEDDLLGRLEKLGRTEDGLSWDVIKFPAIAESEDPLGRDVGQPLWPERISLEELEMKKKGLSPYNWSAIFQQRPSPEEGGGVRRAWWKYYQSTKGADASKDYLPRPRDEEFDTMIQVWDLAWKDLASGDYTVGQVWGRKGVDLYLVDQFRDFANAPRVIEQVKLFQKKYPKATAKLIEDKASGPAVIAMLQHEVAGVIPFPARASKDARLQAVVPLIAAGNVFLPNPEVEPWVWEFIEECAAFPTSKYDDQLDAMVHALTYLQPQGWLALSKAAREAKLGPPPATVEDIYKRQFSDRVKKRLKLATKRHSQRDRLTKLGVRIY